MGTVGVASGLDSERRRSVARVELRAGVSISAVWLEGAEREGFLLSYHKLPNLINLL